MSDTVGNGSVLLCGSLISHLGPGSEQAPRSGVQGDKVQVRRWLNSLLHRGPRPKGKALSLWRHKVPCRSFLCLKGHRGPTGPSQCQAPVGRGHEDTAPLQAIASAAPSRSQIPSLIRLLAAPSFHWTCAPENQGPFCILSAQGPAGS